MRPALAQRLWALAGEPKDLLEFPKERHEFQEDRGALVAAVCDWLESRLAARAELAEPTELGVAD